MLGLLWSLIVFFASRDLGANQTKDLKKTLLDWVQKRCARRVRVDDLGASLTDGRAFLALLEARTSRMNPQRTRPENLRRAFDRAEQTYGAPRLLDETDADFYREDKAVVAYLAELVKRLLDARLLEGGRRGRRRVLCVGNRCRLRARSRRRARHVVVVQGLARRAPHAEVPSVALVVRESNASVAVAVSRAQP